MKAKQHRTENDQSDGSGVSSAASIALVLDLSSDIRIENREAETRTRFTSLPSRLPCQRAIKSH